MSEDVGAQIAHLEAQLRTLRAKQAPGLLPEAVQDAPNIPTKPSIGNSIGRRIDSTGRIWADVIMEGAAHSHHITSKKIDCTECDKGMMIRTILDSMKL